MTPDKPNFVGDGIPARVTRRTVLAAGAAATALAAAGAGPAAAKPTPTPPVPAPSELRREVPGINYVCERCGGNTVTRDAWAEWDVEEQDWVLGDAFDYAYCHDCDRETKLREVQAEGDDAG